MCVSFMSVGIVNIIATHLREIKSMLSESTPVSTRKERTNLRTVNSQFEKETILPYNTEIDEITEYRNE